ncbi:MAG: hypothetical protein KDA91_06825 [Planctomycetaceae bacterium]|nr:hypothetical protein [Planctomycetaceae bacterium]
MTLQRIFLVLTVALLSTSADAQIRFHFGGNPHDQHGHSVHGHSSIHAGSHYVIPQFGTMPHGTYSVRNGIHLYYPQTASSQNLNVAPAPEQIAFGEFNHVDDLALRFETLMNELCLDLYYNYSHNPGFRETYAEAYSLLQTAKFIHNAEHHNDRDAIRSRLGGADQLFHHVEEDFRGWSRVHRRQIGTMGILTKMEMAEATLHHLMHDVGVAAAGPGEQAPVPAGELAPPPSAVGGGF